MQNTLNPEQQVAADHLEGPLLVLAGAGSGKTRVATYRIVKLLERGIPAESILAVTFTNKAAQEMKERVRSLINRHVLITTFHSLGVRILRESIGFLGHKSDFTIYDEEDTIRLLKSCLSDVDSTAKDKVKQAKALKEMISRSKNALKGPAQIDVSDLTTPTEQLFPQVYLRYQKQLKEYGAVDFDDLLFLPARLFAEHPQILEHYQNNWQYLLVDEYQDTNHAQYEMVHKLVDKTHNLFVVGDPDQSIYSWRGANMSNILNFEHDYPGATVVRLEQNYRSCEGILNAANGLIAYNCNRYEKKLWSNRGQGAPIRIHITPEEKHEVKFVVNRVQHHHVKERIPLSDMVVFYRTNFQSRVFEDQLLSRKIPYVIVGGISFYQRREIKDILAYLRMVYSGADFVSFARTINLPKRGVGNATVDKIRLAAESREIPVITLCEKLLEGDPNMGMKLGNRQKEGIREYVELINLLRDIAREGSLKELVKATINKSGYWKFLEEDSETLEDRRLNLQELIAKALEWDKREEKGEGGGESETEETGLGAFLEELSLKSSLDTRGVGEECLHLMTMHNGKGLEFAVTFMVGMEEGLFPHFSALDNESEMEEERRLCYVGMTRARDYLYLSAARMRNLWGNIRCMPCSRFLKEIPGKYVKWTK